MVIQALEECVSVGVETADQYIEVVSLDAQPAGPGTIDVTVVVRNNGPFASVTTEVTAGTQSRRPTDALDEGEEIEYSFTFSNMPEGEEVEVCATVSA